MQLCTCVAACRTHVGATRINAADTHTCWTGCRVCAQVEVEVCVIREVAHEWPHVSGPRRTGSVLQLQLAFVPDTVPLSSLRLSPRCLSASLPLSLAGSPGIKARLSDSIWYFSWAPNGSVSVKQALFLSRINWLQNNFFVNSEAAFSDNYSFDV